MTRPRRTTPSIAAGDFPHAEQAASEILSLPLYPELTEAQVEQVVQEIGD